MVQYGIDRASFGCLYLISFVFNFCLTMYLEIVSTILKHDIAVVVVIVKIDYTVLP